MTNYSAHPLPTSPCPPALYEADSLSGGLILMAAGVNTPPSAPKSTKKPDSKRAEANRQNAKKSTGAVTPEGKAASSMNAVRHGLLSSKAVLPDEDKAEYQQMLNGLLNSLEPVGLIEELLVEKVAVAFWKQRRLLGAEAAVIQVNQSIKAFNFQTEVRQMAGLMFDDKDLSDHMSADDQESLADNTALQAELDTIDYSLTPREVRAHLKANCPLITDVIEDDDDWDLGGVDDPKIWSVIGEIAVWSRDVESKLGVKRDAVPAVQTVKAARSAPITNELLHRYQVAVDGELYRALAALRHQQEHRLKRLDAVVI